MMQKRQFVFLAALFLMMCCSDPISNDQQTPEYEYHDRIEVVYTRDLSITSNPVGPRSVILNYVLFDLSESTYAEGETFAFSSRSGAVEMVSIGDSRFRAYLEHVLIHLGYPDEKYHYVYVFDDDENFHKAIGEGVEIQKAIDEIVFRSSNAPPGSTELKFKIAKE